MPGVSAGVLPPGESILRGCIYFDLQLQSQQFGKMRQTTSSRNRGGKVQEETTDSQNARSWISVILGLQLDTTLHEIPFDECIQKDSTTNKPGQNLKYVRPPPCISCVETTSKHIATPRLIFSD